MTKKLTDDQKSAVMQLVPKTPKQPRHRYELRGRSGIFGKKWHKVFVVSGETVATRCEGCPTDCRSYFDIPPERVSDD